MEFKTNIVEDEVKDEDVDEENGNDGTCVDIGCSDV